NRRGAAHGRAARPRLPRQGLPYMARALVALIAGLCLAFPAAAAQSKTESRKSAAPAWSQLKPEHRAILAPLAQDRARTGATRRKKWIAIAERYPRMKPAEQKRLQANMKEWARLTPEQRRAAREKFRNLKKLPPKQRREVAAQWRRYQKYVASQPGHSPSDPPAPPEAPRAGSAAAGNP